MNQSVQTDPGTPSRGAFAPGPWVLGVMIVVAAMTRLMPHPPNFSPVAAMALFGGAYFASRAWAVAVPLLAMLLSDLVMAVVAGGMYLDHMLNLRFLAIYACIAFSSVLGFGLRGRVGGAGVLGYSLLGAALFFLVTNFAVWAGGSMYPMSLGGLGAAYVAGIPFFQWTVLGTLFYAAVLFGGFALMRKAVPALRVATASYVRP